MKNKSLLRETRGGIAANTNDNSTIHVSARCFNPQTSIEPDPEYIDFRLHDHFSKAELKTRILELQVSSLIPAETADRLFRRYKLQEVLP